MLGLEDQTTNSDEITGKTRKPMGTKCLQDQTLLSLWTSAKCKV